MNLHITRFAAVLVAALAAPAAQALSLTLSPAVTNATIGDSVMVDLLYDFAADPTLGGGVDLFYDDDILDFNSFVFDAAFADDPLLRRSPDDLADELNGLGFGALAGIGGTGVVGTYTFTALATGMTTLVLAENDAPVGGFFSAATFDPQAVDFGTGSVTVNAAVVPEPSIIALLGLGLACMVFTRRRADALKSK